MAYPWYSGGYDHTAQHKLFAVGTDIHCETHAERYRVNFINPTAQQGKKTFSDPNPRKLIQKILNYVEQTGIFECNSEKYTETWHQDWIEDLGEIVDYLEERV